MLISSATLQLCKVNPDEYIQKFKEQQSFFEMVYADSLAQYELKLVPKELQIIQGVKQNKITAKEAEKWLKTSELTYDFLLRISIPESGRKEFLKTEVDDFNYDERLTYYAFEFMQDISVSIDGETLTIKDYHFERDFGIGPHGVIRFSVSRKNKAKELVMTIDDQVYGAQTALFVMDLKRVEKLPKLKHIDRWKN